MHENDLVAIARRYETDKRVATLNTYERFFRDFRSTATAIFEIGVKRGGSIRTWAEYFPNARVVGLDLRPAKGSVWPDAVTLVQGDQGDAELLRDIGGRYGPFDVVIEDGSHRMDHQQLALSTLWPFVKPGGLLIIEDINTSYEERFQVEGFENSVDFLTSKLRPVIETMAETDIDSVMFGFGAAILTKREDGPRASHPLMDEVRFGQGAAGGLNKAARAALKTQMRQRRAEQPAKAK